MLTITGLDEMRAKVGEELGISDWHPVSQEDIDRFITIANTTEINAVVIDIKEELVFFDTEVPLFHDAGDLWGAETYRALATRTARRAATAGLLPDHAAKDVLTALEDPA